MKKLLYSIIVLMLSATVFAQAPQSFNYQAVARDASGEVIADQQVNFQFIIREGSASGTAVYIETHTDTTNQFGLVNLEIGNGNVSLGTFTSIDWSNNIYYLEIVVNSVNMGTSQLLSVPYALHAKTAENIAGTGTEVDPVFIAWDKSTGISITESQISDLDHFVTSDEIDPVFGAHVANGISSAIITNWTTAYNWSNHADAGYLISEVDGSITNEIQTLSISNDSVYLSDGGNIKLPVDLVDDADADSTNEIQFLTFSDDTLFLSNGNYVTFQYDTSLWNMKGDTIYYNLGNVGIGITSPNKKLEVGGTVKATAFEGDGSLLTLVDASTLNGMQSDEFITGTDFEEFNRENMINNASFEIFNSGDNTYPDYWSLLGEEGTNTINRVEPGYIGSSAVEIKDLTNIRFAIQQEIYSESELPSSLLNETITLSVWVKKDAVSGIAIGEIAINDGSSRTVSSLGDSQSWHRVSLTHTIATDATKLVVELCPTSNNPAETGNYIFDAVMLTLGSFTPSFDLNTLDQLSTENLQVSKLTVSESLGIGTTNPGGLLGLQDANTYINVDGSNNLTFTDAVTGTKTLAELVDDALAIGDSYGGGVIFWIDASGKHGLISSTTDQSTGILWYNGSYPTTNAVRDGVYAGQYNTERIINNQGIGDYAAQLCANYQGDNYGDWYLPSIYELYLMYLQRAAIGGFVGYYWSSTEYDDTNAWRYYVDGGTSHYVNKGLTYTVRAVRAF